MYFTIEKWLCFLKTELVYRQTENYIRNAKFDGIF